MKIKNIEFDEKALISFAFNRRMYNSIVIDGCIAWNGILRFEIVDDFGFTFNKDIQLEYTEFDFNHDLAQLDSHIQNVKAKLISIIEKNGRNINEKA